MTVAIQVIVPSALLVCVASCRARVDSAPPPSRVTRAPLPAPAAAPRGTSSGFLGVLIAPQTVDVAAQLDGRVLDVGVRPGDRIAAGATIARLDGHAATSEVTMAEAAVLSARANLDRAKLELAQDTERARRRATVVEVASGPVATVSGEELETARNAEKIARAQVTAAQAALLEKRAHLRELETFASECAIRAPFAGTVSMRYVDAGATVRKGQSIVRLIESAPLRVRFAVPEQRVAELALGVRVHVLIGTTSIDAIVEKLAPEIDAAARAVFAEARLDGASPANVRSGQEVRVWSMPPKASRDG